MIHWKPGGGEGENMWRESGETDGRQKTYEETNCICFYCKCYSLSTVQLTVKGLDYRPTTAWQQMVKHTVLRRDLAFRLQVGKALLANFAVLIFFLNLESVLLMHYGLRFSYKGGNVALCSSSSELEKPLKWEVKCLPKTKTHTAPTENLHQHVALCTFNQDVIQTASLKLLHFGDSKSSLRSLFKVTHQKSTCEFNYVYGALLGFIILTHSSHYQMWKLFWLSDWMNKQLNNER